MPVKELTKQQYKEVEHMLAKTMNAFEKRQNEKWGKMEKFEDKTEKTLDLISSQLNKLQFKYWGILATVGTNLSAWLFFYFQIKK